MSPQNPNRLHRSSEHQPLHMRKFLVFQAFVLLWFLSSCAAFADSRPTAAGPTPVPTATPIPIHETISLKPLTEGEKITLTLLEDGSFDMTPDLHTPICSDSLPKIPPLSILSVEAQLPELEQICDVIIALRSESSFLLPATKNRLQQLDTNALILNWFDKNKLCGTDTAACYRNAYELLVLTPINSAQTAYYDAHEIGHFISTPDQDVIYRLGNQTVTFSFGFMSLNDNYYLFMPDELLADFIGIAINRWLFGVTTPTSVPEFNSYYVQRLREPLTQNHPEKIPEFNIYEQYVKQGVYNLLYVHTPDQGASFIEAWAAQDMETAFGLLSMAFEPAENPTPNAQNGVRIFADMCKKYVEFVAFAYPGNP